MTNPRPFSWAEAEWMVFCARRGIPLSQCASAMGRDLRVVMARAKRLGLKFRRAPHTGGRTRHPDSIVRQESARRAALARWTRLKEAA